MNCTIAQLDFLLETKRLEKIVLGRLKFTINNFSEKGVGSCF